MPSFNLVDQPWLPCVAADGTAREVSLRRALLQAHEVRDLFDPSPLVTVALHRLLLAVLHRAYVGPPRLKEWEAIWQSGQFAPDTINAYLDRYRERFDLFDPASPFYQVPFMPDLADPKKQAPIAKLAQEAAAGNNATLFDHSVDLEPIPVSAAAAARYLVAVQGFSIGFGKSFPFYLSDSTLIRGYSVLAAGGTLFETLLLNLMPYTPDAWSEEGDAAAWERAERRIPVKEGTTPDGYCDLLTWQSRQIHLIPDADGETVSRCQFRQGLKLLMSNRLDPFKCHLRDEQRGWRPRSFRPERALWRDSTMLFAQVQEPGTETVRRPELMNWLARVGTLDDVQPIYRLRAYGLTTDDGNAASVVLWRREEVPLPLAVLDNFDALAALQEALDAAEDAGRALGRSARDLAERLLAPNADQPDGRKPDAEKGVKPLARALAMEQRYWPRLDVPFAAFLTGLAETCEPPVAGDGAGPRRAQVLRDWATAVRAAAEAAFDETTAGLDTSARSLKAVAAVRPRFRGRLTLALETLASRISMEEGDVAA